LTRHDLFSGAKGQFMVLASHWPTIPSNAEYSVPQVKTLVWQVDSVLGDLFGRVESFPHEFFSRTAKDALKLPHFRARLLSLRVARQKGRENLQK